MQPWKTLSKRTLLKHSKYLTVESHTIELPDKRIVEDWLWLIMPDYVNVVAVTEEMKFLCFRQNKYSIEGLSLAPVGGYLEEGEEALAAAKRELAEETGYQSSDWTSLGHYPLDGNRGAGSGYFFLARNAHWVEEVLSDDLEEQELLFLTKTEVRAALDAKEFKLLPWVTAFGLALLKLYEITG
jgi:ADP-ribose pyrophosphatase